MSDEIVEPWHGQTFMASPPPDHIHSQADVAGLVTWQTAIERSLDEKRTDIETLKKCFLILLVVVVFLIVIMLVTIG